MNRIIYWHAPLWEVLCITIVSLLYVGWLTFRNARRPSIIESFPLVDPVLGKMPMFFFTHTEGLQRLNSAATARLAELQASPVFMDSLLEAHIEGRVIQERITPHKDDTLVIIPLATVGDNIEGVFAVVTSGAPSAKSAPSAKLEPTKVPNAATSENWFALGQTLQLHNDHPRVRVAQKVIHIPYTTQRQWQEFKLNVQEDPLLRKLVQAAGKMQTAEILFKCAWPEDVIESYGLSPSQKDRLRRLVYQLRQHVEPDPRNPEYIHTAHGFGYIFYRNEEIPSET